MQIDQILSKVGAFVHYIYIGLGVIFFALGLAFLIVNRRMIKLLHFVSGAQLFASFSFLIGYIVIAVTIPRVKDPNVDDINYTPIYILLGSSAGLGLIGGILGAVFDRFGTVVLGLAGGLNVWQLVAGFVNNMIANLVCSLVLAIIGALLCGFFTRPMEVIIAAFTGAHLFTKGMYLATSGGLRLSKFTFVQVEKFLFYAMIAEVASKGFVFIVNCAIHLHRYFRSRAEEMETELQDVPETQPMLQVERNEENTTTH